MTTELIDNERDPHTILADRDNHMFSTSADLGVRPVAVQGTNKVFFQNRELSVEDAQSKQQQALDDLIAKCEAVDTSIDLVRLPSLVALQIHAVDPHFLLLKTSVTGDKLFVVPAPVRQNVLAFKRLSSMLSIPYSFSKKNPTFLNKLNFDYYLNRFKGGEEKPASVDIVFDTVPTPLELHTEEQTVTVQAHLIRNFLKVSAQRRGRPAAPGTPGSDPDKPSIVQRVPLFSSILAGVKQEIEAMGLKVGLQAHTLGYESNGGQHYARLLLDGPDTTLLLNGEEYRVGIAVTTDFLGDTQNFGDVRYSTLLFRQICSNGMIAQWKSEEVEAFKQKYLNEQMLARGFDLPEEMYADKPDYATAKREIEALFHIQFSAEGLVVPVVQANAKVPTQILGAAVKALLNSEQALAARLQSLKAEFADVDPEEFIKTTLTLQKAFKMKSPELIKYMLLEYTAGQVGGNQTIRSPHDVLQYLTLIGRSYSTAVMADVEEKAMRFSQALYDELIAKSKQKAEQSLFDQYRAQLQERLLVPA